MRTFAYCRVSTSELVTANQLAEITAAGFTIERQRVITEEISGSSAAIQRPGFQKLLERMESGDTLIITRLDRLGRDAIDVMQTVKNLEEAGVKVHCLQLGGVDLTSSAGKMVMGVISAMAEFERNLIIERTKAGVARARAAGAVPGRPRALSNDKTAEVKKALKAGQSIAATARKFGVSRATVMRAGRRA